MSQWINFAELRRSVSLEDVLFRYYQLTNLKRDGNKVTGPCPVHGGDSPRAFAAQLDRNVWHCFTGCQAGGNQIDFVAKRENISVREAALKLHAFFGELNTRPTAPTPPGMPAAPKGPLAPAAVGAETTVNKPLTFTLELKGDHPHLLETRGLSPATIAHFGVGYCSRGIMKGMITVPIHDQDGELVAYAGRRLRPSEIEAHGKYRFPAGVRKDLLLFGYHRIEKLAVDHVIVVEGFFSVMKLHDIGIPNVVALMGCSMSAAQAQLLSNLKEVILLLDGDEAGIKGATAARELLASKTTTVRTIWLPRGEPEDYSVRHLRWLINGVRQLGLSEVSFQPAKAAPTP